MFRKGIRDYYYARSSRTEILLKAFKSEKIAAILENDEIDSKKIQIYKNLAKSYQWKIVKVFREGLPSADVLVEIAAKEFGEGGYAVKNGTFGKKFHSRFILFKLPTINKFMVKWEVRNI